ncbi:hypothetical protein C8Q74DRAFT_1222008 [Fomes fomentarius]|nr:hypothetical protein C8Q74DRAFT_1222008 [Fomes fomentarius]
MVVREFSSNVDEAPAASTATLKLKCVESRNHHPTREQDPGQILVYSEDPDGAIYATQAAQLKTNTGSWAIDCARSCDRTSSYRPPSSCKDPEEYRHVFKYHNTAQEDRRPPQAATGSIMWGGHAVAFGKSGFRRWYWLYRRRHWAALSADAITVADAVGDVGLKETSDGMPAAAGRHVVPSEHSLVLERRGTNGSALTDASLLHFLRACVDEIGRRLAPPFDRSPTPGKSLVDIERLCLLPTENGLTVSTNLAELLLTHSGRWPSKFLALARKLQRCQEPQHSRTKPAFVGTSGDKDAMPTY